MRNFTKNNIAEGEVMLSVCHTLAKKNYITYRI